MIYLPISCRIFKFPIAAYVSSYNEQSGLPASSFVAHDTRKSTAHPLRHAVMNVIRTTADHRASQSPSAPPPHETFPDRVTDANSNVDADIARNGSNYLLTSMTLFTTHEPCVMCSMALLHSRVKEVVYLVPMERTGGCGGLVCLPKLEGVNHRFEICRWNRDMIDVGGLEVDAELDA